MMTSTNGNLPTTSETVLKSKRRYISLAEKIRMLKAVEAAAPGKQGALLRREGIYSSQVSTWRRQLERGDLDPHHYVSAYRPRMNREPRSGISLSWNARTAPCVCTALGVSRATLFVNHEPKLACVPETVWITKPDENNRAA